MQFLSIPCIRVNVEKIYIELETYTFYIFIPVSIVLFYRYNELS